MYSFALLNPQYLKMSDLVVSSPSLAPHSLSYLFKTVLIVSVLCYHNPTSSTVIITPYELTSFEECVVEFTCVSNVNVQKWIAKRIPNDPNLPSEFLDTSSCPANTKNCTFHFIANMSCTVQCITSGADVVPEAVLTVQGI